MIISGEMVEIHAEKVIVCGLVEGNTPRYRPFHSHLFPSLAQIKLVLSFVATSLRIAGWRKVNPNQGIIIGYFIYLTGISSFLILLFV